MKVKKTLVNIGHSWEILHPTVRLFIDLSSENELPLLNTIWTSHVCETFDLDVFTRQRFILVKKKLWHLGICSEFFEIFKNSFLIEQLRATASVPKNAYC